MKPLLSLPCIGLLFGASLLCWLVAERNKRVREMREREEWR